MANYQDLFFTVADGLRLYARDYAGPSPQAPVALLMHGLSRNSRDFQSLAPILAQTHRVLVPEQRGRGKSDYDSDVNRYQPQNYIADTLQLLAQQRLPQVAVIGTSMGGLMALGMNAIQPGIFSHVVLNDIGPELAARGLDRIKTYVGSASEFPTWELASAYCKEVNGDVFPNFQSADWLAFARQICSERDGKVMLDYDGKISVGMKNPASDVLPADLWSMFDLLRPLPLMLIRGAISDLLDEDCVAEMQRRHSAMAFLEVPNVGHAPMLNENGVAEAIAGFINSPQ